jgi:hypothetical protein
VTRSIEPFYDISLGFPFDDDVIREISARESICTRRRAREANNNNGRGTGTAVDERKDSGSTWLDKIGFFTG